MRGRLTSTRSTPGARNANDGVQPLGAALAMRAGAERRPRNVNHEPNRTSVLLCSSTARGAMLSSKLQADIW